MPYESRGLGVEGGRPGEPGRYSFGLLGDAAALFSWAKRRRAMAVCKVRANACRAFQGRNPQGRKKDNVIT